MAPPVEKPVEVLTKSAFASEAQAAGSELFFFRQKTGFENDFEQRAAGMRESGDCGDFILDHVQGAGTKSADVLHHVEFACSRRERRFGFSDFGGSDVRAEREADYGTDADRATGKLARGETNPIRIDAD